MKPPILSDEQIRKELHGLTDSYLPLGKRIATAQLDATEAHYEPLIQQLETIKTRQEWLEHKLNDVELAIQQAKAEVAREMIEELETKFSIEGVHIPAPCASDKFIIRRDKWQSFKEKVLSRYTGGK